MNKLIEKGNVCLAERVDVPGAPLWHMGKVALLESQDSFDLLQNTIDYLTCKGKNAIEFSDNEKEFLKELFEAMWWGGKYHGYKEAATLASHYVNGDGHSIRINPEVYKTSVIVSDVCKAMKAYAQDLASKKRPLMQVKSTSPQFRVRSRTFINQFKLI